MILQKIIKNKRNEVKESEKLRPLSSFIAKVKKSNKDFKNNIRRKDRADKIKIIAEYKRASPSSGNFAEQKSLAAVLNIYNRYASALSILTDKKFFNGSLDDIKEASNLTRLPILRKDFIIDEYQIYESRSYGADTILLIVKILTDEEIKRFLGVAKSLGMQCIVEINDREEFERIKDLDIEIIGINNRNFDNLSVDKDNANNISRMIRSELAKKNAHNDGNKEITIIAESGLSSKEDINSLASEIDAALIGTAFVKLPLDQIEPKFRELLDLNNKNISKIKICGITNIQDALSAAELGADFIGLIFYSKSKRFVEDEKAREICKALADKYPNVKRVGVFVDEKIEKIVEKVNLVGLDFVQLHGNENNEFIKELKKKIKGKKTIKAIRVREDTDIVSEIKKNDLNQIDYLLLDTYSEDSYGGTGKSFDWDRLDNLKTTENGLKEVFSQKVFLSGGINVENIAKALEFSSFAIDISSGVESSPGKKDEKKLIELFQKIN